MKIVKVSPLPDYKLRISFDDGASGIIALGSFVSNGMFSVLQDVETFNKVYTTGYSVAWSDELELDALTIYTEVIGKEIMPNYRPEFVDKIQQSRKQITLGETRVIDIENL